MDAMERIKLNKKKNNKNEAKQSKTLMSTTSICTYTWCVCLVSLCVHSRYEIRSKWENITSFANQMNSQTFQIVHSDSEEEEKFNFYD